MHLLLLALEVLALEVLAVEEEAEAHTLYACETWNFRKNWKGNWNTFKD